MMMEVQIFAKFWKGSQNLLNFNCYCIGQSVIFSVVCFLTAQFMGPENRPIHSLRLVCEHMRRVSHDRHECMSDLQADPETWTQKRSDHPAVLDIITWGAQKISKQNCSCRQIFPQTSPFKNCHVYHLAGQRKGKTVKYFSHTFRSFQSCNKFQVIGCSLIPCCVILNPATGFYVLRYKLINGLSALVSSLNHITFL